MITSFDPENNDITVKLADFDTAKFCPKDKAMMGRAGTVEYMAPEIFNKSKYTANIDVWSLCVVIYTQLFGNWPFPGMSEELTKNSVLKKEPSFRYYKELGISQEAINFL